MQGVAPLLLPPSIFILLFAGQTQAAISPLRRFTANLGTGAISFLMYWFAAVIVWMWNQEFRSKQIAMGASIFVAVCILVLGYGFFRQSTQPLAPHVLLASPSFAWICLAKPAFERVESHSARLPAQVVGRQVRKSVCTLPRDSGHEKRSSAHPFAPIHGFLSDSAALLGRTGQEVHHHLAKFVEVQLGLHVHKPLTQAGLVSGHPHQGIAISGGM